MKLLSIVTPCYNEVDNVEELVERIRSVMTVENQYEYEHILIDNASTDGTQAKLREMAATDKRIKVIFNARNFGHIRSPHHGILQGQGDAVIWMASDLQDPPELISSFLRQWEAGFYVVMAVKPESETTFAMHWLRRLYYNMLAKASSAPIVRDATGFGLYDKKVMDTLRKIDDPYPYFRGLVSEIGFPVAKVEFKQPRRKRGITKNNVFTLYDIAMLGITNHTKVPLRIMAFSGFLMSIVSFLIAIFFLAMKLLFWDKFSLGTAPILIGMFSFFAIQLFFLGVLGEYVGAVLTQVKKIPLVVEIERINFPDK
jgi:glycosyltransferase involved in cell wall biosynthesis